MDVRSILPSLAAGGAGPGAPIRVALPDTTQILAAILETTAQFSQSDVAKLIGLLEITALPGRQSELPALLLSAVTAARNGNTDAALKQLATLVRFDPVRAETLRTEPGLEQIRVQVDQLLTRLESAAGSEAQARIAEAAKVLDSRGPQPLPGWDMAPRALLTAANRLIDAGGYVNTVRAAAVAGAIIEAARPATERSTPSPVAIRDTAALLQLSPSDAGKLVRILEPPAPPQQLSTLQGLLRAAVSAVKEGDPDRALQQLAEFVRLEPNRAEALRTEPDLEPIRAQVEQLLTRLESLAGLDAQTRLAAAAKVVEARGLQPLPGWDAEPRTLLTAADRLYDAGGHVNYVRAGSIAEVVVEGARTPVAEPAAAIEAVVRLAVSLRLSPPDTEQLVRILEPPGPQPDPAVVRELVRSAVATAQEGDTRGALKLLEEVVRLDPSRAATLRAEPDLQPIRAQVDQLLTHVETKARSEAQAWIADAAKAVESRNRQPLPGWDAAPQILLTASNRLCDAGGYVNCLYAASLAQLVVEGGRLPLGVRRTRPADLPRQSVFASTFGRRLKALWARAPLFILLVSWLVLGLAAIGVAAILHAFRPEQYPASIVDGGFTLWGIGFLALVLFGLYMRVRRDRDR